MCNIPLEELLNDYNLMKRVIQNNIAYIKREVDQVLLPTAHLFLQEGIEDSAEFHDLAWLLLFSNDNEVLDRFIKRLPQTTDFEKYHQLWAEISILKYIRVSLFENDTYLKSIFYDKKVSLSHRKDIDFSIEIDCYSKFINIEIKRVTCEPTEKENEVRGKLFIKKLFKDVNLETLLTPEELSKYTILSHSTHYQALKDEIKDINDKYHMTNNRENSLNIGIVNVDYATSFEEFISYLANTQKGLIYQEARIFKNIDVICLYFNNPSPQMHNSKHCFTFIVNNNIIEEDINALDKIGLGNIIYKNNTIDKCFEKYAEELYTTVKLVMSHKIMSYYRTDVEDSEIDSYHEYLYSLNLHTCDGF